MPTPLQNVQMGSFSVGIHRTLRTNRIKLRCKVVLALTRTRHNGVCYVFPPLVFHRTII